MKLIKLSGLLLIIAFTCVQCGKKDAFLIEKGKVGLMNKSVKENQLKGLFVNDSLVNTSAGSDSMELYQTDSQYMVYSKAGKKLLEINMEIDVDSVSKLKSVQIYDPMYKTASGIGLHSLFKDINENYMINKVETTLTSATLFIDELNATISIDKKELGLNNFSMKKINVEQIPEIAKIKYFTVWFN